jgi:hypothetical protein
MQLQCYQRERYLTLSLPRQLMVQLQVVLAEQAVVLELEQAQVALQELLPLKYQTTLMCPQYLLQLI